MINGDQVSSRISSRNELVQHSRIGTARLGIPFYATSLWDKLGQIWSKMAYNVPISAVVLRYN